MEPKDVPYIVHEGAMVRLERANRRLWVLCIIMFLALVVSNAGWIWYENQFIDEVVTVEQENDIGHNNYIGNDEDINNG